MTAWARAAAIRAAKTAAQTAVALLGTGVVGILDVDWIAVLSASALAAVLSVLTSISGLPETAVALAAGGMQVTEDEARMLRDYRLVEGRDVTTGAVPTPTEP